MILWHQVSFPDQRVKVSSDVYSGDYIVDAGVSITYSIGQPGTFQVTLANLPQDTTQALGDALNASGPGPGGGVNIKVKLGYLEDLGPAAADIAETVLDGRVESIEASVKTQTVSTTFKGHETAAFRLLNTNNIYPAKAVPRVPYVTVDPKQLPMQVVSDIVTAAGTQLVGSVDVTDLQTYTEDGTDGFDLLEKVARRYGAEVLVQEGSVAFGKAVIYPPPGGLALPPDPTALLSAMGGEDALIVLDGLQVGRLAEFKPVVLGAKHRFTSDLPDPSSAEVFDFTILGLPRLRAGALVVANVDGFDNPFKPFRVLQVTHAYSINGGYTCSGRAVAFKSGGGNRQQSDLARAASAVSIADRITSKIKGAQESYPSIDVGSVKAGNSTDHLASLLYRQGVDYSVASPSIDLDIDPSSPVLVSKPLLAPFAFYQSGLSVPVYPGMRALLTHVRDAREDAVVAGFLWTNKPHMDRPKAKSGDWWLCLPTKLDPQGIPTGPGANDLTAGDGRRVIEAVGLRVIVGKASCSNIGERPVEGTADEFTIEHKSGTKVTIASGGDVKVETKSQAITLTDGSVTLKVANGKVAIT